MNEPVTTVEQDLGNDSLATQDQLISHIASENEPQSKPGSSKYRWSAQRPSQCLGIGTCGYRRGGHSVEGTAHLLVVQPMEDRANLVGDGYPAHVLIA